MNLTKCCFIQDGKRCNKKAEYEIICDFESGHRSDRSCSCHVPEFLRDDADEFMVLRI